MQVIRHSTPRPDAPRRRRIPPAAIALGLVLLLAASPVVLNFVVGLLLGEDVLWAMAADAGHSALREDIRLRSALLEAPGRLVSDLFRPADLPLLTIDIKFKHMQKLHVKRARARRAKVLIQGPDDFVPASIRVEDRTVRVKLRLKGDLIDHLEGKKWSFRIHTRGDGHIFGMRRFSVQHPKTRGYQSEALINELARAVGLLAPRYRFVRVEVNGDSMGVMAMEEHFSKELLEFNRRREGVIVRFDESLMWAAKDGITRGGAAGVFDNYRNAHIDAFESGKIARSPVLSAGYAVAVGLLRGFVEGSLAPSRAFDTQRLASYLAVAQLFGSWHMLRWHNQRFYLNPFTARLEPIVFDANLHNRRAPGTSVVANEPFTARILRDPAVFDAYRAALADLSARVLDGTLRKRLAVVDAEHLAALQGEFPLAASFPLTELEERARWLASAGDDALRRATIDPDRYPVPIHANLVTEGEHLYLELANALDHPVIVREAHWESDKTEEPAPLVLAESDLPVTLASTPRGTLPSRLRLRCRAPEGEGPHTLQVNAAIAGSNWESTVAARAYHVALSENPVPDALDQHALERHPFLARGETEGALEVRPGRWRVSGSLVIPPAGSLTVPAGTTLSFAPGEALIAHGPLNAAGTPSAPVVFEGFADDDGTSRWQGVAVLSAGDRSSWSHVTVRDTTGVGRDDWALTGGVTFYESDFDCTGCTFRDTLAEDALNIVRSRFALRDVTVSNTASDGFDADFSEGVVEGGLFVDIGKGGAGGGDAVDVSGSMVTVSGTVFRDVVDKALSVGEGSTMSANGIRVERVGTAAASKDGSRLTLSESSVTGAQVAGLMAYVKKAEYGPGRIDATGVTITATELPAVAQIGSQIGLNGEMVPERNVDVDRLYDTVMKKGGRP